ncbi:MAG: arsenite methyltransferase [Candidatus Methylomirabilales bacterium]
MKQEDIKTVVKEAYAGIARERRSGCGPATACCGGTDGAQKMSTQVGYSKEELRGVPEGADLGLGCGNPLALASLREGETVLDLGSGAGLDVFLAAGKVGKTGRAIGVDMTAAMIERATENATRGDYGNVEFRLGDIEDLPVADNTVDVVISNCVINLSPDKPEVFREAYRVLTPGGRLMISDIVLLSELPDPIKRSVEAYIGCVAGAMLKDEYVGAIRAAGFQDIQILHETSFPLEYLANDPTARAIIEDSNLPPEERREIASSVVTLSISAVKPIA